MFRDWQGGICCCCWERKVFTGSRFTWISIQSDAVCVKYVTDKSWFTSPMQTYLWGRGHFSRSIWRSTLIGLLGGWPLDQVQRPQPQKHHQRFEASRLPPVAAATTVSPPGCSLRLGLGAWRQDWPADQLSPAHRKPSANLTDSPLMPSHAFPLLCVVLWN